MKALRTLALLALALAAPAMAQDADADRGASILLDERGRLVLGPPGAIDLREMIRENDGALDVSRLQDMIAKLSQDGHVTGRVFASRHLKPGQSLVAAERGFEDAWPLPMVEITLEREDRPGATFGPWRTTQAGSFVSQPVPAGLYVLCADGDGWQRHCREVEISGGRLHLEPFAMRPDTGRDLGSVFGRVQLADGGFPQADVPYANILEAARVTAFAPNGTRLRDAFVNSLGDYVLPALPAGGRTRIVVTLEGADTALNLPFAALAPNGFLRQDVTLPNSRPVVSDPVARLGGLEVFSAPPGETVEVAMEVSDPDGDPASVRWFLDAASGVLSSDTDPATKWTLPEAPGPYTLRAVITDGRGGVRTRTLRVTGSPEGELFTGTVSATDASAVANAEVTVNGVPTATNGAGYFAAHVKPAERYVLNIRSPGHALMSQIHGKPSRGGRYELVPATVQSFDPARDIEIQDRRREEDCRGAPSAGLDWEAVDKRRIQPIRLGREADGADGAQGGPRFADLPAELSPQRKRRHECGPGASVVIPAGSLVDADGNEPPGMVEVAISTYDIEAEMEMPGDWTVAEEGEVEARGAMESYGAAFVEVRDATREYNLAPGAAAELRIPVAPAQLAVGAPLAPSIPVFHYDEARGVWNETGQADLDGMAYVAKVEHFSAINADVEKVEPACIHVRTESDGGVMPDQFTLEVTIPADPGSGAAAKVRSGTIDASASDDHVVYNLPENRDIVLVPYDPVTEIPYGTFVVDSGSAHGSAVNPPDPALCTETAELFIPDVPRQLPSDVEYLQGLFSFFAYDLTGNPSTYADDLLDASNDYYAEADPLDGRRDTFGQFKAVWGFDGSEANARYANSADLGFGRDMHCTASDIDSDGTDEVACYVSNYGFREDPDQDNANWASDQLEERYVATVAMEFAPVENPGTEAAPTFNQAVGDVVKFFVYGRDPDPLADADGDGLALDHDEGGLVTNADLDGYGNRPIPQLCMVCHGGTLPNAVNQDSDGVATPGPLPVFGSASDVDLGSRFLPFDLESYTFPTAGPVQGPQEAAFKALNQDFVAATELSQAIEEVIEEFYAPGGTSATQNRNFVIPGWQGNAAASAMYEHVVGPNCRICHVAHDGINRTFETAGQLPAGFAGFYACTERSMPHSVRTYERLWTSIGPHQPGQLANYIVGQGGSATDCAFPPNNGQTFELP